MSTIAQRQMLRLSSSTSIFMLQGTWRKCSSEFWSSMFWCCIGHKPRRWSVFRHTCS